MPAIALLDPSLPGENDSESDNLGDVVIADATMGVIGELFPRHGLVRLPTKRLLDPAQLRALKACEHVFLGGTNILNGDLALYNQWRIDDSYRGILFPKFAGVIALGVGWWQYQQGTTLRARLFYKRILHRRFLHSVRDQYSLARLTGAGVANALNTCCPTLWRLDGLAAGRRRSLDGDIVFTLTDYHRNVETDEALIEALLERATRKLLFFPQGAQDVDYISTLAPYRKNKEKIIVEPRRVGAFNALAQTPGATYVGTRLHGGVRFLQHGRDALILAVDNRAAEIHKDTGLPVLPRSDLAGIGRWLAGETDFGALRLPVENIARWKAQFAS